MKRLKELDKDIPMDYNPKWSELELEVWMAMVYRDVKESNKDKRTLIMEWARKRWDVMAINQSLLLPTIILLLVSIILTWQCFHPFNLNSIIFIITCCVLVMILISSRQLMFNYLIEAYLRVFPQIFDEWRSKNGGLPYPYGQNLS
jgi:hypothetical protein